MYSCNRCKCKTGISALERGEDYIQTQHDVTVILTIHYLTQSYPILSYLLLSYPIFSCPILSSSVLSFLILSSSSLNWITWSPAYFVCGDSHHSYVRHLSYSYRHVWTESTVCTVTVKLWCILKKERRKTCASRRGWLSSQARMCLWSLLQGTNPVPLHTCPLNVMQRHAI